MNVLILGIGNILLRDEGVGVRAIEELSGWYSFADSVELLDGGTSGLELLDQIGGRDLLIIIDAMKNGMAPGSVSRVDGEEVAASFMTTISPHQLGISDLLATARLIDSLPARMVLFGIEPEDLSPGLGLSESVSRGLEMVATAVEQELGKIGLQPQRLLTESGRPPAFWSSKYLPYDLIKEATS